MKPAKLPLASIVELTVDFVNEKHQGLQEEKLAAHLKAPDYAAPYDVLQGFHQSLETSSLMGRGLDLSRKSGRLRDIGADGYVVCAQARSKLDSTFAVIDRVTLRHLYAKESQGAKAPWKTLKLPVYLMSQVGSFVGFMVKAAILGTAFAVRLGAIALCRIRHGAEKSEAALMAFLQKEMAVQSIAKATNDETEKFWKENSREIQACVKRAGTLLSTGLEPLFDSDVTSKAPSDFNKALRMTKIRLEAMVGDEAPLWKEKDRPFKALLLNLVSFVLDGRDELTFAKQTDPKTALKAAEDPFVALENVGRDWRIACKGFEKLLRRNERAENPNELLSNVAKSWPEVKSDISNLIKQDPTIDRAMKSFFGHKA